MRVEEGRAGVEWRDAIALRETIRTSHLAEIVHRISWYLQYIPPLLLMWHLPCRHLRRSTAIVTTWIGGDNGRVSALSSLFFIPPPLRSLSLSLRYRSVLRVACKALERGDDNDLLLYEEYRAAELIWSLFESIYLLTGQCRINQICR